MVVWHRVLHLGFCVSTGLVRYSSVSERTAGRFSTKPHALQSRNWFAILILLALGSSDRSNRRPSSPTVLALHLSRCQNTPSERQRLDTKPSAVGWRCHTTLGFVCVFCRATNHDSGRGGLSLQASQGNRAWITTQTVLILSYRLAPSMQHGSAEPLVSCQYRPDRYRGCIGHDQLRDASRFVRITRDYIFTGAVDLVLLCPSSTATNLIQQDW